MGAGLVQPQFLLVVDHSATFIPPQRGMLLWDFLLLPCRDILPCGDKCHSKHVPVVQKVGVVWMSTWASTSHIFFK